MYFAFLFCFCLEIIIGQHGHVQRHLCQTITHLKLETSKTLWWMGAPVWTFSSLKRVTVSLVNHEDGVP